MAATVTPVKTKRYKLEELTFTALTTSGITIDYTGKDEKIALIFFSDGTSGANDNTITILAGDGIQGVKNITLPELTKGDYCVVGLDSGEFKNVTGTNKGYIVVKGKTTTTVAALEIFER